MSTCPSIYMGIVMFRPGRLLFGKRPGIFLGGGEMNKRTLVAFLVIAFAAALAARTQEVRRPAFAGAFYDEDKAALAARIDAYLNAVKDLPAISAEVRALICPPAGYIYSGQ